MCNITLTFRRGGSCPLPLKFMDNRRKIERGPTAKQSHDYTINCIVHNFTSMMMINNNGAGNIIGRASYVLEIYDFYCR